MRGSIENSLALREAQASAVTDQMREEESGNAENPILYAEAGPCRYQSITLFFQEEDGVRIEEDLDLHTTTVYYFTGEGETELTQGALYDWALNFYEND
jgi:hypothetical protein